LSPGTVPVGIHAFTSRSVASGLEISWSTVSENENIGFYIWGDNGRQFELLTPEMIPAQAGDVMTSREYSATLSSKAVQNVQDLVITAVDQNGKEEMYGMFSIGGAYGRDAIAAPIDWAGIRMETAENVARHGLELDAEGIQRSAALQPDAVDFRVQAEGMQRVTYDDLVAAGLDLRGVTADQIAVTLNGQPVPRKVHSILKSGQRGTVNRRASNIAPAADAPSMIDSSFVIDFWGERPAVPDALYVDDYTYRITVDQKLAVDPADYTGRRLMQEASFYWRTIAVEDDNSYDMGSVLDDPWAMKRLRANHSTDSFSTTINLPADRFPGQPAFLEARVAGITDLPQAPDHQVALYFNGERVETVEFDGRVERLIRVELSADKISSGQHEIQVRLPGGTEAPFDLVALDSVSVTYAATLSAANERLLIESIDANRAFTVAGLDANSASAFAWDGQRLVELPLEWATLGNVLVTPEADSSAAIWLSAGDAIHRPSFAGAVTNDALVTGSPDLLVIAHPAFMPVGDFEAHPLNDYIAHREAQGWSVAVVDITRIQAQYSNGMPLPQAVSRFLADASSRFDVEHVLLVGGDSYDYHDRLGMGSLSFIPTVYGNTRYVPHSPSDALMSDLDGDGLGDLAVGRWPVRSMGDLQSIVQKTLDWDANMVGQESALWAADSEDPNIASFAGQVDRMLSPLRDAGWSDSGFDTVQVGADQFDSADKARAAFFKLLEEGRALTGYTGHGSAGVWSFQGFLFPSDLAQLNNDGLPTLIGTMACYTSYFSSPSNDTVAHRWMNGFRLDSQGEPVPGAPNGAVAVHGAATLSNYAQNEVFASEVLRYQLDGMTLGESVRAARAEAQRRGINDLVVNWTLLGDPTVRIVDPTGARP
jgi:sulfur carrier protein ThiS